MSRSTHRRSFLTGLAAAFALAGAGSARASEPAPAQFEGPLLGPDATGVVLDGGTVHVVLDGDALGFSADDDATVRLVGSADRYDLAVAVEDERVDVRVEDGEAELSGTGAAAGVVEQGAEVAYGSDHLALSVVGGVLDVTWPVGVEYDGTALKFVGREAIVRYDGSELAYTDDVLTLVES
ncbi:hypothetical protein [Halomarina litorea]|uniref:hypothetical protein n=1 Tax=Halomarina litorea TaxID=2961595 RepID=UPI0020C401C0|nr:hypothetical protein [Halomarina sp. BCD28]